MSRRLACAVLLAAVLSSGPASAQERPTVTVGPIASQKLCTLYESWWGYWLVLECSNNFAPLRLRVESALAESGKLSVATGRGALRVTGSVTELGITETSAAEAGYSLSQRRAVASLDLRLTDTAAGRVLWQGTVTRAIPVGGRFEGEGFSGGDASSPRAIYTVLQRELALSAARAVAFNVEPLRVVQAAGPRIQLNYGAPLLKLGDDLDIVGADGRAARYRVSSASGDTAWAEASGSAVPVSPGARVSFVEADDPAANRRRFDRVELP